MASRRPSAAIAAMPVIVALGGCASVAPTLETSDRLAAFPVANLPLEQPVTIRWNEYYVPHVRAETDRDLAVALGLVHMHLREGQLALARRAAEGRLSESAGPLATDIDHALRILDIGRAAEEVVAGLPDETRAWLEAYVEGLNAYQRLAPEEPPEFALLGLERERWEVEDVVAISRIAGADANWFGYFSLLPKRGTPEYDVVWERLRATGAAGRPSIDPREARSGERRMLQGLFETMGKMGSNSVAIAPSRTRSGAAMLANDPHLGFMLPNPWILVGLESPAYNAVGFSAPGVPVIALGRSPTIAWGGTNMRAASSELTDVSGLDPSEIRSREVEIGVRFWFDETRTVRETRFGPILSDADVLAADKDRPIALRWMGFEPSDEYSAFLRASRASNGTDFRAAFEDFGVSAQNILFATADGHIGMVLAGKLPRRAGWPEDDLVRQPGAGDVDWENPVRTSELPWTLDPARGFIASANNRPAETTAAIGYLFSSDDRVTRLSELVEQSGAIDVEALARLQRDTRSPAAEGLAAEIVALYDAAGVADRQGLLAALRGWDGDYAADAFAPVAFETLLAGVVEGLAERQGVSAENLAMWEFLRVFLAADLEALPEGDRAALLTAALEQAAGDAAEFESWGEMHRLPVRHALGNLPAIGGRFEVDDLPVGGSRETPMKTAHGLVRERHEARFGSQSRHISDMADLDANYFTLFGGNDGWLGSPHLADQMPLWRDGRYIRMPLRSETVEKEFPFVLTLEPARRSGG